MEKNITKLERQCSYPLATPKVRNLGPSCIQQPSPSVTIVLTAGKGGEGPYESYHRQLFTGVLFAF